MREAGQDPETEAALRWLVVLRDPGASAAERAAFAAWLGEQPAHAAAWRRAEAVWARLDGLEPALRASPALPPGDAVAPFRRPRRRAATPLSRRRWLQAAAAAGLLVAGAGYAAREARLFADYATGTGERRSLRLPDGSTVELGSRSALSLAFDAAGRGVELHEGEAFFRVAADPARPFVVVAGGGRTRALGTAFDVKRRAGGAAVAVVEHAVAVSLADGRSTTVGAGQQLRYGDGRLGRVVPADLPAVLAWRRGRLIFRQAPLGEVVAELERYRSGRILVTDGRLEALPVTAVFDSGATDAALETIADSLPVELRRLTDLLVLLSPRA